MYVRSRLRILMCKEHVFIREPVGSDPWADFGFVGRASLHKLDKENDLFIDDKAAIYLLCGPEGLIADVGICFKLELFGTGDIPEIL